MRCRRSRMRRFRGRYTLYGPPEHADGTIQATKNEAMPSKEHFAGQTTE